MLRHSAIGGIASSHCNIPLAISDLDQVQLEHRANCDDTNGGQISDTTGLVVTRVFTRVLQPLWSNFLSYFALSGSN